MVLPGLLVGGCAITCNERLAVLRWERRKRFLPPAETLARSIRAKKRILLMGERIVCGSGRLGVVVDKLDFSGVESRQDCQSMEMKARILFTYSSCVESTNAGRVQAPGSHDKVKVDYCPGVIMLREYLNVDGLNLRHQ
jgi:hypothetical protein